MDHLELIAFAGGLYVPLLFWHFLVDWLTQTEKSAEKKHYGGYILARHCLIYSIAFLPFFWLYGLSLGESALTFVFLYFSHAVGDTGAINWLWAKYLRKMTFTHYSGERVRAQNPVELFNEEEPVTISKMFRPVLWITIDQLWHATWLWLIVILALYP